MDLNIEVKIHRYRLRIGATKKDIVPELGVARLKIY